MKKIIIIFITLVVIIFISIIFVASKNNKYISNMEKEIRKNYGIKDNINYLNKSDLYYIIVTTSNLIVLDKDYQEIFKEEVTKLEKQDKDYEIVYRLNQVMYQKKNIFNNKIVYEFHDIYTNELIDTVEIGG